MQICWELLTSLVPYANLERFAIMYLVGSQHKTLPVPDACPDAFASLLAACWAPCGAVSARLWRGAG